MLVLFPLAPEIRLHLLVSIRPRLPLTLSTPVLFRIHDRERPWGETALASVKLDALHTLHFRHFHDFTLFAGETSKDLAGLARNDVFHTDADQG